MNWWMHAVMCHRWWTDELVYAWRDVPSLVDGWIGGRMDWWMHGVMCHHWFAGEDINGIPEIPIHGLP